MIKQYSSVRVITLLKQYFWLHRFPHEWIRLEVCRRVNRRRIIRPRGKHAFSRSDPHVCIDCPTANARRIGNRATFRVEPANPTESLVHAVSKRVSIRIRRLKWSILARNRLCFTVDRRLICVTTDRGKQMNIVDDVRNLIGAGWLGWYFDFASKRIVSDRSDLKAKKIVKIKRIEAERTYTLLYCCRENRVWNLLRDSPRPLRLFYSYGEGKTDIRVSSGDD